MKALSIKQPWADWILGKNLPEGIEPKDIENRSWLPPKTFNDPYFYIHTSQKIAKEAFDWFRDEFKIEPINEGYTTGAIIGKVMLCDYFWHTDHNGGHWGMNNLYHWLLADPEVIEPIPAKGMLGFWDCSKHTVEYKCKDCGKILTYEQFKSAKCDYECSCGATLKQYERIEK
jgi:hypothetical protein